MDQPRRRCGAKPAGSPLQAAGFEHAPAQLRSDWFTMAEWASDFAHKRLRMGIKADAAASPSACCGATGRRSARLRLFPAVPSTIHHQPPPPARLRSARFCTDEWESDWPREGTEHTEWTSSSLGGSAQKPAASTKLNSRAKTGFFAPSSNPTVIQRTPSFARIMTRP